MLASLPVKGRARRTGYGREEFGPAWADVDRNGCDTRNDVLRRDLTGATFRPGTRECVVVTGTLVDPYTGGQIGFTKANASAVQIDHVVALGDAWQKGAQQWSSEQRRVFANDPLNLLAVDGPTNAGKGDSDAASWLPPARPYRCRYVARQVAVKARYGAWVTAAEKSAIGRVLADCPDVPVPAESLPPAAPTAPPTTFPSSPTMPAPTTVPPATSPTGPAPTTTAAGCDPAYPGVCIPPVSAAGDLDCADIAERRFVVRPPDPHRFDSDGNGLGCER